MDDKVLRLTTPEECEVFIRNAANSRPDLVNEARRRLVELKAARYGAKSDAEREAVEAIHALEEVATQRNGKKTRASRTWQSAERYGLLEMVERVVSRADATEGYRALINLGLEQYTFESVVLRHSELFKPETVAQAKLRLGNQ